MSISSALSNALTGLTASARTADVISANVANALTPGYGRRQINLSAATLGGTGTGVRVDSVTRQVDMAVVGDRRLADADVAGSDLRGKALAQLEAAVGAPGQPGALGALVADLENALVTAAGRPDSEARLQAVATTASRLAGALNGLTRTVQDLRMQADADIASQVALLNTTLGQIDTLNADILAQRSAGRDATALMDQRQVLVDRAAAIVPLREVARDRDQIALFSTGGAILLEGNPAQIGFAGVGVITADMTLQSGALSGLTINGMAIATGDAGPLRGGSLGALFVVRDQIGTDAQAQFDALARDLVERFSGPAADPTLAAGQPGLFTDAGGPVDVPNEAGLAGRLAFAASADPGQGGALWRLRDGIAAAGPGPVGNATQLATLAERLSLARVPASGGFTGAARTAGGLVGDVLSRISGARLASDAAHVHAVTRQAALADIELSGGVDTDAEMQHLLLVEQSFSANARVIQTLDALIQQLIGL